MHSHLQPDLAAAAKAHPTAIASGPRFLRTALPAFALQALVSGEYGQEYLTLTQDHGHGHWRVLVHWPSTSLIQCPRELSELGRRQGEFSSVGALIIGVAGDTHSILHSWRGNGRQAGKLPYPIIDDRKQEWARAMHLAVADASTITPSTLIVDPQGDIRMVQHHHRTSCRDIGELLNTLSRLIEADVATRLIPPLAGTHLA
jgi:alkyl hydroperoxide reductase subunit AhpC